AGDVERDAEEQVGGALVQLERQPALGDGELEQGVTRRQGHVFEVGGGPRRDDEPAGGGGGRVGPGRPSAARSLAAVVDPLAAGGGPGAPLLAVDVAEFAVLVGPLVPDADVVLLQLADVGRAAQKPEQFVDDVAKGELLGGDGREALAKVEADLLTEDAEGL